MKISKTSLNSSRKGPSISLGKLNERIEQLTSDLGLLKLPSLDSNLVSNSGDDPKRIVQSVIAARFTKYWERPNNKTSHNRRVTTIRKWHENEERVGLIGQNFLTYSYTIENIQKTSRYFSDVVMYYLDHYYPVIEFSPGESYLSRKGDLSIMAKLEPEYHTVSEDCLEPWVNFCSSCRGFFKPYLSYWFKNIFKPKKLNMSATKYLQKVRGHHWKKQIVIETIESLEDYVVKGSRQAFVTKDNDEDRSIEVNPFGDVILQKAIGWAMRKAINDCFGVDLNHAADVHKEMIQKNKYCTLDASKASDSITFDLIGRLFNYRLTNIIAQTSQEFINAYHNPNDPYKRSWIKQNKLCSMGNGYTFELLSAVFILVARTHTYDYFVYGDDLIAPNEVGHLIRRDLERLGFVINETKSFINQPFRESCGAFYLDGVGYIETYKLKWASNEIEAITELNKLGRVCSWYSHQFGWDSFFWLLYDAYQEIVQKYVHPIYLGPIQQCSVDLVTWVEYPDYLRLKRKKKSAYCRTMYNQLSKYIAELSRDFMQGGLEIVATPVKRKKIRTGIKKKISYAPLLYATIYSNRLTVQEIRDPNVRTCIKYRIVTRMGNILTTVSNTGVNVQNK